MTDTTDTPISALNPCPPLTGQEIVPVVNVSNNTSPPTLTTLRTTTSQFRGIPQNLQNQNYQFALTDAGDHVYHTDTNAYTYTIPANAVTAFLVGATITIVNGSGAGVITIAPAGGVTLLQAGTSNTGNRSLAAQSMSTTLKIASDTWMINGAGLT
jgi:hypothetical protein